MRLTLNESEIEIIKELRESEGEVFIRNRSRRYRLTVEEFKMITNQRTFSKINESRTSESEVEKQETESSPFDISALNPDGSTMSFSEWCQKHNFIFPEGTTFNLITHTGKPYYNVRLPKGTGKAINISKVQTIIESLSNDITPYKNTKVRVKRKMGLNVYFSDKHIGAHTEADSIYSNDYNSDVLMDRMNTIVGNIVSMSKRMPIDNILLADLGDALDGFNGFTTRGGHKLPQNMSNEESFELYIKAHKFLIDNCVQNNVANNYCMYFIVNDNHSGVFGYLASRALKEYVNLKYPFVDFIIQEKFLDVYKYGNHSFVFTHGKDKVHMFKGMPKLLNERTELFLKDYISKHKVSGKIHVVKGDLHQDSVDFCNQFRYRNVLSMYGASGWIHHNFGWNRSGVSYEVIDKFSDEEPFESRWFFD